MTTALRALTCSVAAIGLSLAMTAPTLAKGKEKAHGVQLKRAPITTYANGLDATQRQRSEDARLRRECKGRPNAGACLGYAR